MDKPRVTQLDIAKKARVSRATVSLALKGHRRIPAETQKRILAIAEELGYQPDPMLAALAVYRNRQRPSTFHGTLAWVTSTIGGHDFRRSPHYSRYFIGATNRAIHHGYQVEVFESGDTKGGYPRLSAILKARGVSGILVSPSPDPDVEMNLLWDDFSAITFGYSLTKPRLHTIAAAHYRSTQQVFRQLIARGYRRCGLVISKMMDCRCDHNIFAAYLAERELAEGMAIIPPCFDFEILRPDILKGWLQQYRPDAILTSDYRILGLLKEIGLSTPDDIGVACLSLHQNDSVLSGVVEDSEKIGAVAVDSLIGMIQRNECGIPSAPLRSHLEGHWCEGTTIRPPL